MSRVRVIVIVVRTTDVLDWSSHIWSELMIFLIGIFDTLDILDMVYITI